MYNLTIKSLSFSVGIKKKQVVTVKYKLASDPDIDSSYTLYANGLIVGIDGAFQIPVIITGLEFCTFYTVAVFNECSGVIFKKDFKTSCVSTAQVQYGFTELDTTGDLQPDSAYIAAVDTGTILSMDLPGHNVNIQVDDFTNDTDKVCFIQVPAAEAAFTKWSEVGNPLQQNQPIDQAYGTGSNVWYKTTRGIDSIYITRSQTAFAGPIILSR